MRRLRREKTFAESTENKKALRDLVRARWANIQRALDKIVGLGRGRRVRKP